jgi:bifunctional non-homologous end joining protein LigD
MLATSTNPGSALPSGPAWAFEVKWDGVRVLADTTGDRVRLWARSGREVTAAYPELAVLSAVPGAVLDGEVVAMADGVPSFEALAARMHVREPHRAAVLARELPVSYLVFDVLTLDGTDVTRRTFDERRDLLERLDLTAPVTLSPVYPDGAELWDVTRAHGLEGVVAKRRSSTYQQGRRSPDWVKAAHRSTRTALVAGWREETSGSGRLGAVLIAAPDADGVLRYLGRAGSGLARSLGGDLRRALEAHSRSSSPLDDVPALDARGTRWCAPVVAVDVAYLGRTRAGRLRHPVVRGLRDDVPIDPWEGP